MQKPSSSSLALILASLFFASGIIGGGYFISQTMYNAKVAINIAEAKGLAERRVKADLANWNLTFFATTDSRDKVGALYQSAEKDQQRIINILKENGFSDAEIKIGVIDYRYAEYRDENQIVVDQKHILDGSIQVETTNVDLVAKARTNINKLITEGINIQNQQPIYRFTGLNDIKPDMLREATQNARIAANEFAANANTKVGKIRSARQGGFYIRDAGEEYSDTAKIDKDVRVVTTIEFYLSD